LTSDALSSTPTTSPPPNRRAVAALLGALASGVIPQVGSELIVVGRAAELGAVLADLAEVEQGGAGFRLISGPYGAGKSFMLSLIRSHALNRNFVVASADLSPVRRFSGSEGQGLATYRELAGSLATRARPDGGAMGPLLERWISGVRQAVRTGGVTENDPRFAGLVEAQIHATVQGLEGLVHGYDFGQVISAYWQGYLSGDEARQEAALRWLRGEYATRREAQAALGVRVTVSDADWYEHLKLLALFVKQCGYAGLVVIIDEAVNLSKITNSVSRNQNYERLLTMFNDTLQGRAKHLEMLIGATPEMIEDAHFGLFSYDALRTRLQDSRFVSSEVADRSAPVLKLDQLQNEEVYTLLHTLRDLHAQHHKTPPERLSDADLLRFMEDTYNRLGARDSLTPREVTRNFVSLLNLLAQYPDETYTTLTEKARTRAQSARSTPGERAGKAGGAAPTPATQGALLSASTDLPDEAPPLSFADFDV